MLIKEKKHIGLALNHNGPYILGKEAAQVCGLLNNPKEMIQMKPKHKCKKCNERSKNYDERSKEYAELSKNYAEWSKNYAELSKYCAEKCNCKK